MPKIPTAKSSKQSEPIPTKRWLLAEHLGHVAITRGLYYTGFYDKMGENLKVFNVAVDAESSDALWLSTSIQGHTIELRITKNDLLDFIDGNGLTLNIPKNLRL
jgi:hypothetical protein